MKIFKFCSWVLYFKYYITATPNFGQKISFYHFSWLASENPEDHFFSQKLVKNQEPDRYEIDSKVNYWFQVSTWPSKQNYKRISRNTSLRYEYIADVTKYWYQQKSNDILPNYRFSFFKISHCSIFNGSMVMKFCKKTPIPPDVSIKLLTSGKNNNVTNSILTRWLLPRFYFGDNFTPTQKNPC